MIEFAIKDVDSSTVLQFEGEVPCGLTGRDGCFFVIRLVSIPLSAAVRVYDIQLGQWADFFADLAVNWQGWSGEKDHESLEGHLRLEATSDASGHIRLFIRLRDVEAGSNWLVETSMALEAGQLKGLADRARAYFG
ncbi:DUF6228 family protein [Dyella sp. GSA-30]|uniref:DUF6228 family protein n=1 Tax=Dyella sp. GSA-30 TaxID=2994496 RepID=UPI002491D7E6|nr:DUF6228 family protein [Dyella sp. GSA-30]BDU20127.1 hypothetical protein DYGSA30_15840 [Dyella sp. GSA-30]